MKGKLFNFLARAMVGAAGWSKDGLQYFYGLMVNMYRVRQQAHAGANFDSILQQEWGEDNQMALANCVDVVYSDFNIQHLMMAHAAGSTSAAGDKAMVLMIMLVVKRAEYWYKHQQYIKYIRPKCHPPETRRID